MSAGHHGHYRRRASCAGCGFAGAILGLVFGGVLAAALTLIVILPHLGRC